MERETHNFSILKTRILERSVSKVWESAKTEWDCIDVFIIRRGGDGYDGVVRSDESGERSVMLFNDGHRCEGYGICLCTHEPIVEHCVLLNKLNGSRTIVGNICVKNFLGIDMGRLFDGIKRIRRDLCKSPNSSLIEYAARQKIVNEWELGFMSSTQGKRATSLTFKQRTKRQQINEQILAYIDSIADAAKEKAAVDKAAA
ncbi:hypothetical protein [Paraburkholderia graminis]|uniref:hypothetical protein n=1 Tax=Paraburkholderia graminis TaxID=60548 RepID=UPI0038BA9F45